MPVELAVAPKPAPTPKNGAPPSAPQTPPEPLESKPEALVAPDPRMEALEKGSKLQAKRAQELAARHKEIETKAANLAKLEAELEEHKRLQADKRRNPGKYLEKDYGPNWYETVTKYRLEGAPTGDLIASEMDEREQGIKKLVDDKTSALQKEIEALRARDAQRQQSEHEEKTISYIRANAEKFPLVNEFAEHKQVLAEMQDHFRKTMKQGPDGEWLPGEVLTAEQAAAKVESRIAAVGERFAKYSEKKQAGSDATKSSTAVTQRNEAPQRRALSTTITASSAPTRIAPRDDSERTKAAIAAWELAEKSRS